MQLLFFLIWRNWRRDTESDLPNSGFLRLGGGSTNILDLLCALLDRMMGGRVRHGLGMQDKDEWDKRNKLKKNP
jgi:hypothetical protein